MHGIVADTSPLNYLVLIEAIDIPPRLYDRVLIPPAVRTELSHAKAPESVRGWISQPPSWLEVVSPISALGSSLAHLDPGERDAIVLAVEQQVPLLLADERDGRAAAIARGLRVVGTLGALDGAAAHQWIDLPTMINRLRQTSFRGARRLMATILEQDAKRKG